MASATCTVTDSQGNAVDGIVNDAGDTAVCDGYTNECFNSLTISGCATVECHSEGACQDATI